MVKCQIEKFWLWRICSLAIVWNLVFGCWSFPIFAQDADLEFSLDVNSNTIPLPKIFRPNIDLSGRGFHRQNNWPQALAAPEAIDVWQKDIGFGGLYRIQYNLWEINQAAKDKEAQDSLLSNYENIIKRISDAGGIVILNIFGTPAGLGKALDKKSAPLDMQEFTKVIKNHIRRLSCDKRYNIWYEVWSAPDLEDFFLGRKQEYLFLYRAIAESIRELEIEAKIHIPIGGPSVSWWFQNLDSNTIVTPETSLIYELIKFCYSYRLPLNFITWHAYSADPRVEKEITGYNKMASGLIRDWLSYFHFDRDVPLIVDEWNFDSGQNVLAERSDQANICASFIPARIKNMHEAGIDHQLYFSLEDFQDNKEGVLRNTGLFWYDSEHKEYKGGDKSTLNVFRMLANLGDELFMYAKKLNDEFIDVIATKGTDYIALLIYNYIDPGIAKNYLSRNLMSLNEKERRTLLSLITSGKTDSILSGQLDAGTLRTSNKVKTLLKKARELNTLALKFKATARPLKIEAKNLKDNYLYEHYTVDASCSLNCQFSPAQTKEISDAVSYQETLLLEPYSVHMVVLKKRPAQPEAPPQVPVSAEQPAASNNTNITSPVNE